MYMHPIERVTALIRFYWLIRLGEPVRVAWRKRTDGFSRLDHLLINEFAGVSLRLFEACQDVAFSDKVADRWEDKAEHARELRAQLGRDLTRRERLVMEAEFVAARICPAPIVRWTRHLAMTADVDGVAFRTVTRLPWV